MSAIALQTVTVAGTTPSYQAATASDNVPGATTNERVYIHAKNSNAATATITINPVSPLTARVPGVGVINVPAISVVVPATTGDKLIGPIPAAYIDATGNITLANTGTNTNLTLAAILLPAQSA